MAQHASQIGPEYLEAEPFPVAYGREWFLTGDVGIGHRPVIECLLGQGVDTAA